MRVFRVISYFSVIFFSFLLMPGCAKKEDVSSASNRYLKKKSRNKKENTIDTIRLQEAKLSDIPIPLSSRPIPYYFDAQQSAIMLGYNDAVLSLQELVTFYMQEMERLGWEIKEQFYGYESQLRFKKPDRSCIVSIRTDYVKHRTKFVICSGSNVIEVSPIC